MALLEDHERAVPADGVCSDGNGNAAYTITSRLKRFDPRFTAFSRSKWDPSSASYRSPDSPRETARTDGKPGYGREEHALEAAAWTVARSKLQSQMDAQADKDVDDMEVSESSADGRYEPPDLQVFTHHVKEAARLFGASLVGVARVNPMWIYACDGKQEPLELPEGIDTAVVMAIEMDYEGTRTSPTAIAGAATADGYSRMDIATNSLARYFRELGWRAKPSGNDTALSIPLAVDAGLGELGRNGLLITRPYGPRVRLCKVFTDAPLIVDRPVTFGVREFCDVCMKCADTCPSDSISKSAMTTEGPTPSNNHGAVKWYVDPETCLAFWRKNGLHCANCIRSCPYNKVLGPIHDLARGLIRLRSRLLNRALVLVDDLLDYGSARDAKRAIRRYHSNGRRGRRYDIEEAH